MSYDAGILNDYGGGNVEWWQDYIRTELGRANDYWQDEVTRLQTELEKERIAHCNDVQGLSNTIVDLRVKLEKGRKR